MPSLCALRAPLLLGSLLLLQEAHAGPPKSVRVTTYKEFAEGQPQGVLLSSQGEVLAGAAASRLGLPSLGDDSVRALAPAPGGVVYVGTGGEGPAIQIYEKGKLRRLVKLEATTWVTALCVLPRVRPGEPELLATTAQDGRVFLVGRDGKARVFAQVEADHIWTLVHDARRGVTFAATGPGRVFAIDARGKSRKIFDSGAKQILSLALLDDGQLVAGTADDAVLYRIDPDRGAPGNARALHDFAGTELRALWQRGGVVYAAVNDMARGDASTGRPGVKIVPAPTGTAPGSGGKTGSSSGLGERQGKGAIYRIDPDGRVEQLHAISDGFFNDLFVDNTGDLFAAASTPGGRGRVYWVKPDRTVLTALELKESDVLALAFSGPERVLGTGNSGAFYRIGPLDEKPRDANYVSKVFDGGNISRWGTLRYAGSGPLKVETRTGNLGKPDATWGGWQALSPPARQATGEWGGKVMSPAGRYLQVRVGFGQRAALQDFSVSYQPQNQRPRVQEIQVGEDPLGRIARGAKSTPGKPRQPLVKLRWKVENPDEDELIYRLYVRPIVAEGRPSRGGPTATSEAPLPARVTPQAAPAPTAPTPTDGGWLRLGGPDPLTKPEFEWNTESVPDGLYEARVVATDERVNPAEQTLSHELVSPAFVVDNRRPELQGISYSDKNGLITGRAVDAVSPLAELAYSLDGGDFLPVLPRDGVLDDPTEDFAFRLPRLAPGPHTVVVRAADAADNVAAVQLMIR